MLSFLRKVDALDVFGGLQRHKYAVLHHDQLPYLYLSLGKKIERAGYKPDAVIGIVRWGNNVANFLSDKYGVPVYSVGATSYTDVYTKRAVRIIQHLGIRLDEQRVIVADDVGDSGETFSVVKEKEVVPANPKQIKTACLFKKPWTKPTPDFWVEETDRWVLFPNKPYENCRHLLKNRPSDPGLEEYGKILSRELGYPKPIIEEVLEEFSKHGQEI